MAVSSELRNSLGKRRIFGTRPAHRSRRKRCDNFLSFRFEELQACKLETVTERCGSVDAFCLMGQVANYFRTIGKNFEFQPTGNKFQDVFKLMEMLQRNIGNFTDIDLVRVEDRESHTAHDEFVLYREFDDFDTYKIFFMPIKVLSLVDDRLKEILTDFFTYLELQSPFLLPTNSYEMQYSLGLDDEIENIDLDGEEDDTDYKRLVERYTKGDISRYFEEIKKRRVRYATIREVLIEKLKNEIQEYRRMGVESYPISEYAYKPTSKLLDFIEQGVRLYEEDNLLDYELRFIRLRLCDDTFLDDKVDAYDIMEFERQFIFSWELNDDVAKSVVDTFNGNMDASATIIVQAVPLSSIKEKVEISDYPTRWLEWYIDFLDCIDE